MTEWIAVVAFCVSGECAFWAETKKPFYSREECEKVVVDMEEYLVENGADATLPTCIPLRFLRA
jgi:hypothetical protein